MSQVAQGPFKLNFENLHRDFTVSPGNLLLCPTNPTVKMFSLHPKGTFPLLPHACLKSIWLSFFCSLTSGNGRWQLVPRLLNKPNFSNLSSQAWCSALHHDPRRSFSSGATSLAPQSPRQRSVTPDVSPNILSGEQWPSPTCWLCSSSHNPARGHRAGLHPTCCPRDPRVLFGRAATGVCSIPYANPALASLKLHGVPLSALVFLSVLRNEVLSYWFFYC